jgi:DNA replication and repair protein RecF
LKFLEVGTDSTGPVSPSGAKVGERRPAAIPTVIGGPVCGPIELPRGGRDLRLFGSQGEQRAAVLALLLAEQRFAAARTGQQGPLFLDDVMSELDDARRRLLVRMLGGAGQAIITTTNRQYFTEEELSGATVVELPLDGSLAAGAAPPPDDELPAPPPDLDAL